MSLGRKVALWGAIGVLMPIGCLLILLVLSASGLSAGLGLLTFLFPAWPLLQFSGGNGMVRLAIPAFCLASNALLYAAVAYLWYGPGGRHAAVRTFVRVGVVLWFCYAVVWFAVEWNIALRR